MSLTQNEKKLRVAEAALSHIEHDTVIGVGTGSTVNCFIDVLATIKASIDGAVSSSEASSARLRDHGIPVLDINGVNEISVYIDGADECNKLRQLIKGGGGALTREKIVAAASRRFVCIIDDSKLVSKLGTFPLPVEVIPMAQSYVARELVKLGGRPILREDFVTDNGNVILDVHRLDILEPIALEQRINNITGVVCNGLFAARCADVVLMATDKGVERI